MNINRKHRLLVAAMTTAVVLAVTSTAAWAQGPGYGSGLAGPVMVVDATEEEADALSYMREGEKLARDVYTEMYEVWGVAVFNNIAASEQTHMDAVGTLLDRYGVEDPAATTGPANSPT